MHGAAVARTERNPNEVRHQPPRKRRHKGHQRGGAERVPPHTREHTRTRTSLPVARLLRQQDDARGRRRCGEPELRRLRDLEVARLRRLRDDAE